MEIRLKKIWKSASCHCGKIQLRLRNTFQEAIVCNCSICSKKGFLHLIVQPKDFKLLKGKKNLNCYQFNEKKAKHFFCKTCGISPYYIPRSHPKDFDVNLRCVENIDLKKMKIKNFDGKNWEKNIHLIQ